MEREKIREQTISLLAKKLNMNSSEITEEANIYIDLGVTSLKAMELIREVQDRFNFEVPATYLINFRTVGDIINYIEKIS